MPCLAPGSQPVCIDGIWGGPGLPAGTLCWSQYNEMGYQGICSGGSLPGPKGGEPPSPGTCNQCLAGTTLCVTPCPGNPAYEGHTCGYCANTTNDPHNCGGCGKACPAGGASCIHGKWVCPSGKTLCGVECVDTSTDPNNCGACGTTCTTTEPYATPVCSNGACSWECLYSPCGFFLNSGGKQWPVFLCCPPGETCCRTGCTNTLTDPNNCGGCAGVGGTVCPPGQTCSNGACACPPGQTLCGDTCCPSGQICSDGMCACPPSQTLCGNTCCPSGQNCSNGACACPPSQTLCGNTCCPSSCTTCGGVQTCLDTDPNNCGGCGMQCQSGQPVCSQGHCCPSAGPYWCNNGGGLCCSSENCCKAGGCQDEPC